MNLKQLYFTQNNCYKAGVKITPKGIMVHSTGANNPTLRRYVGPDDGLLGVNTSGNHWNIAKPGGSQVCVHAFIGKLKDGSIATYQTLPWDMRGWHSGSGKNGTANDTHISFEICEDGLTDKDYFDKVYQEAVELCAYLCKLYNLNPLADGVLITHSEGYKRGIASNHADVMHWFPKYGKNMGTFRAAVKEQMEGDNMTYEKFCEYMKQYISMAGTGDNPSAWAKLATEAAKENGLFTGDGSGNYGWQKPITREAVAQVIYNMKKEG